MNDDEVWAAVDRQRRATIELLRSLGPDDWARESLCADWSVHDVAAHLTLAKLRPRQLIRLFMRYPGGTNRVIRDGSKHVARHLDREEVIEELRRLVGYHRPFPGLGAREALIDAIVHTLDIAVPCVREVDISPVDAREAAVHVTSYGGRGNARVFQRLTLPDVRMIATDVEWSTGSGPEVHGTTVDLLLLLTGRTARIERLTGAGADLLRASLASA